MTDQHGSPTSQLSRLDTNDSYWYQALEIYERTIATADQLNASHTPDSDPITEEAHQNKADLLLKAIMQSLATDVARLFPPHVLRYELNMICRIIRGVVDTSSTETRDIGRQSQEHQAPTRDPTQGLCKTAQGAQVQNASSQLRQCQ